MAGTGSERRARFEYPSKHRLVLTALIVAALSIAAAVFQVASAESEQRSVIEFDTMTGNQRPFIGTDGAIRGINAGGFPWVVTAARGELRANGDIKVRVKGLVIDPNDAAAIAAGVAGKNPAPAFKAVVSCLSVDADGNMTTVNLATDAAPATSSGDAKIEGSLALPDPCIAPIIFVTSPGGAWFLSTGF